MCVFYDGSTRRLTEAGNQENFVKGLSSDFLGYAKISSVLFGGMPDFLMVHIGILCIIMFTRISLLCDI